MEYHWRFHADSSIPELLGPDELTDGKEIRISCTQTALSPSKQNALVRNWCRVLPTLSHVKALRFTSRVPQPLFDAACQMPHLEDLWIKWSGVTNIHAIQNLSSLRYFHLGSSARLESIEPLANVRQLKWLGLENLQRVSALDALSDLPQLEGLTLEGDTWNVWNVHSLSPLGSLKNLRYLSLAALRSHDQTLTPLFDLNGLETFVIAQWWNEKEVQDIRRRNRGLG